jgi:Nodulation protein S (NodS)
MLQKMQKYKAYAGMRIPDQVFEDIYATSSDPCGYTSSNYEHQKYSATLAALSRERYPKAFEIGCSIGVLTRLLGERCDSLLSVDIVLLSDCFRTQSSGASSAKLSPAFGRDHPCTQQVDRDVIASVAAAFHTSLVQSKSSS